MTLVFVLGVLVIVLYHVVVCVQFRPFPCVHASAAALMCSCFYLMMCMSTFTSSERLFCQTRTLFCAHSRCSPNLESTGPWYLYLVFFFIVCTYSYRSFASSSLLLCMFEVTIWLLPLSCKTLCMVRCSSCTCTCRKHVQNLFYPRCGMSRRYKVT